MLAGGSFTWVKAAPGWQQGDIVPCKVAPVVKPAIKLLAAAACLMLALLAGFGGYGLYYNTASIISIDINPSMELELNRFGTVVKVNGYNTDATALLSQLKLTGEPYQQAIGQIMSSDALKPYLDANIYMDFSVYSPKQEGELMDYLRSVSDTLLASYPQMEISCNDVDSQLVEDAHRYGMSCGKMRAVLELQALDPTVDAQQAGDNGIGEIHTQIQHQRRLHMGDGQGERGQHGDTASQQEDASLPEQGTVGQGQNGNGHRGGANGRGSSNGGHGQNGNNGASGNNAASGSGAGGGGDEDEDPSGE